ncbi:TrkA C-terminal domain-containing protein [Phytohabitans kaempferiae]|uniref:TrkA C-terminal domain-containing protein n=1 Tax=Phytohabitans kaempferiae TaxID=1620943 RepID=A0ABV6M2L3_9ACTN
MRIDRQELPGIGTLHAFTTRAGQRVGVIQRRDGQRTLALYRDDDPHAVHRAATLDADEAHHLVDLLHPVVTVDHVDPSADQPSLVRLKVLSGSPADGQRLSVLETPDTRVLAIIRDGQLVGWPSADTTLRASDTIVATGTAAGIDALTRHLDGGEH